RLEEGAAVGAVVGVRNTGHGLVQAGVAPGIVAGEHAVAGHAQFLLKPPQNAQYRPWDGLPGTLAARWGRRYKPRNLCDPIKVADRSDQFRPSSMRGTLSDGVRTYLFDHQARCHRT